MITPASQSFPHDFAWEFQIVAFALLSGKAAHVCKLANHAGMMWAGVILTAAVPVVPWALELRGV